ncbi:MAG TPA: serine/threonine-protein kinase, partial [Candidatus Polarisedimenticolaceae bacterium]|nr:serine/threonine-protein kinase [Candidatus Polarisedimenticolaceae bacterium]
MSAPGTCPECATAIPEGGRYCSSCGHPVVSSSALPTMHASSSTPSRSAGDGRFLPGAILAGRYRIIGLLGRGGMGEVYRADDLKLGQAVALKFLPAGFEDDPDRLRRFLDEVKTARQVSHANVCRIYDAGEANGLHFLSMEYVDGEDLASLLRRIGRLPEEKALQIARQLCAGLAASHESGVLHRDLKPANVMIDGRGRARITDFGLAGLAEGFRGDEIRAGTPAYMAPEQLEGREVTAKSDVYALGLVLYELFTGKRPFEQDAKTPSSPSTHVDGFNPVVEKVILRCLEKDPARRPASPLSIAAALPGGDPIAAALAAGETPSPEMVAEASDEGALSPAASWGALGVFVAALVVFIVLASRKGLVAQVPLDKPPDFLRERAHEILVQAGQPQKPVDATSGFVEDDDYLKHLLRRVNEGQGSWSDLRDVPPGAISFWHR